MAGDYVQVGADGAGKKLQTFKNTIGVDEVHAEGFVPVDSAGTEIVPATQATLALIKAKTDNITQCDTDNVTVVGGVSVSGTVTANAGTNLNTSALALEAGGNLASVKTNTDKIPSKGTAVMAGSMPVTIATDDTLMAAVKLDVDKIPSKGTATMAGSTPVTIASDDTLISAIKLKTDNITKADTDNVVISDVKKTVSPTYVQATAINTTKVYDPAGGKKARVKLIDVWNSGAASITVDLRFTAAGSAKFKKTLAANTGFIINLQHCNWEGAADEDLYVNLSAAGTVDITVMAEDIT